MRSRLLLIAVSLAGCSESPSARDGALDRARSELGALDRIGAEASANDGPRREAALADQTVPATSCAKPDAGAPKKADKSPRKPAPGQ